jgi:cysteine desulfuration protein SufE
LVIEWVAETDGLEKPDTAMDLSVVASYLIRKQEDDMASPAFEEIVETFEFLSDWEQRYGHVIDIGKAMSPLDEAFKVPATKVAGCASQVWLLPMIQGQGPEAKFDFQGESDAMIVRGLVAILHALFSGLSVSEVLKVDAPAELARLGLDQHLSAQRSNGLRAMVARIRFQAEQAANG